jgi:hypothetical protein
LGRGGGNGAHEAPAFDDHSFVKRLDAVTAGVLKGEGQQRVEETGDPTAEHAEGEPTRGTEVLQVRLADRGWMFSKETSHSHDCSLGKAPCDSVS